MASFFSLNFAKIEFSYTEQSADGSPGTVTTATWNRLTNAQT